METKHTPGPWKFEERTQIHHAGAKICTVSAQVSGGRTTIGGAWDHLPEWKANASLISAAPELLEAVILAKEFEQHAGGSHLPASAWFELHAKLDAAIAKATGG